MIHKSHGIRFFPDGDGGKDGSGDGDGSDGDGDGEDNDDEDQVDVEALKAENARYKKAEDKRRTQAARDAKAKQDAERKKAQDDNDADKLKAALAEETAKAVAAELKANRAMARSLAAELGAVDPGDVVRLVDFDELADPGNEDEVKAEIAALLKAKPYLKSGKVKTDGGASGGGSSKIDMNQVIRDAAGR
jgi:membrane protein involved in colicin uptake